MQRKDLMTMTSASLLLAGGRALGPITNVFLHVPDDFDVVAWAAGR